MNDQTIDIQPNEAPPLALRAVHLPQTAEMSALNFVERILRDTSIPMDRLREAFELRRELKAEYAKTAYNAAMSSAQSEMTRIAADSFNPQTRSKYASYGALDREIRPIYTKHGFGLSFDTGDGAPEGHVRVLCDVTHNDGHVKQHHIDIPNDGKGAKGGDVMTKTHATVAAVTYGKRCLAGMIFNIAIGNDDDGNAAASNGVGTTITDEQVQDLGLAITQTKSDLTKFLRFFKIEALSELPVGKFEQANKMLQDKGARS